MAAVCKFVPPRQYSYNKFRRGIGAKRETTVASVGAKQCNRATVASCNAWLSNRKIA